MELVIESEDIDFHYPAMIWLSNEFGVVVKLYELLTVNIHVLFQEEFEL